MLDRISLTWYQLARQREESAEQPFVAAARAEAGLLLGHARKDLDQTEAAVARLSDRVSTPEPVSSPVVSPDPGPSADGLTRAGLGAALAAVLKTSDALALAGFGTWQRRRRAARKGRNPRTGEVIEIVGTTTIAFKAGGKLKSALDDRTVLIGRHPGSALAMRISRDLGCPTGEAADRLQEMLQAIVAELRDGQRVTLKGFGSLAVARRAPRYGRNPRTGEQIEIPSAATVTFKAAPAMRS